MRSFGKHTPGSRPFEPLRGGYLEWDGLFARSSRYRDDSDIPSAVNAHFRVKFQELYAPLGW